MSTYTYIKVVIGLVLRQHWVIYCLVEKKLKTFEFSLVNFHYIHSHVGNKERGIFQLFSTKFHLLILMIINYFKLSKNVFI